MGNEILTTLEPCLCGTRLRPRIVRRGTASLLVSLRCSHCERRSPLARPEDVEARWNATIRQERARAAAAQGRAS